MHQASSSLLFLDGVSLLLGSAPFDEMRLSLWVNQLESRCKEEEWQSYSETVLSKVNNFSPRADILLSPVSIKEK
jgi:hypothetical protein